MAIVGMDETWERIEELKALEKRLQHVIRELENACDHLSFSTAEGPAIWEEAIRAIIKEAKQ